MLYTWFLMKSYIKPKYPLRWTTEYLHSKVPSWGVNYICRCTFPHGIEFYFIIGLFLTARWCLFNGTSRNSELPGTTAVEAALLCFYPYLYLQRNNFCIFVYLCPWPGYLRRFKSILGVWGNIGNVLMGVLRVWT